MQNNFDMLQKLTKDNMDVVMQNMNALGQLAQDLATETSEFSKASLEKNTAAFEKVLGAKSLEQAVEAQREFAQGAYESLVAETTKIGEMVTTASKGMMQPYEEMMKAAK